MAIIYKPFVSIRTVLCMLLVTFLIAGPALAQSELFTIENVIVDVTAKNALEARNQAFEKAQQQAFITLAERMLSEAEAQTLAPPETLLISSLIQDYEVTAEKLSTVRYVGTYTFRFKDSAVRQYFSGQGVQYTDVGSKPLLVLPFFQFGERTVLWSPYNAWIQAWNRAENLGGLVPLMVPMGDLQDVKDIGDEEALTYDQHRLAGLLTRYEAGEAVLLIAIPDANLSLVTGDQESATGALSVHIYRTDRAGPEYVQQIVETARPGQTKGQLLDQAVRSVHKTLQKDWKTKTLAAASESNRIHVQVAFKNLQEWSETQKSLQRVYGINEVILRSLSPKSAQIDLVFQGTADRLRLALQQADMTLSEPRISMAGYNGKYQNLSQPLVYDLYMNKFGSYSGRF